MRASDTVIDVLSAAKQSWSDRPALRSKRSSGWETLTWADYHAVVMRAGRALLRLGLAPGDCTVILAGNRVEWFVADLAAIAAGGLPSGIYTTSTPEQCAYIVEHCGAEVAFVEREEMLGKLAAVRDRLRAVIVMDGAADAEAAVMSWEAFLELGDEVDQEALDERIRALDRRDPCTLIYTSGTTGEPKGVLLSHHNVLWTAAALVKQFRVTSADCGVSYLPLSHIAEQVLSLYLPLLIGGCMSFAQSLDTLADDLREVRPTFFFAVPRVWEKIQARMEAAGAAAGPVKRRLVRWARDVGLAAGRAAQRGEPMPAGRWLADRLVFSKVRSRLGFDRTKFFFTAAAPMARSTLDFFLSLGIPILEVYGMTESTGPTTFSTPSRYRTGSAGWAIPGTDLAIATDGEILFRGPNVFLGYFRDPDTTAETLDSEGWVHSGDIGRLDEDGFLYVTDRKKELIITSGGKNVAPVPIEARLKAIPGVAQAVVVGDGRKFLSALILLDPETLPATAATAGSEAADPDMAATCPRLYAWLSEHVEAVNATLAPYESIRRFAVVSGGLSVDDNTLTPTLKLKRRVIHERFADVIDAMYRED